MAIFTKKKYGFIAATAVSAFAILDAMAQAQAPVPLALPTGGPCTYEHVPGVFRIVGFIEDGEEAKKVSMNFDASGKTLAHDRQLGTAYLPGMKIGQKFPGERSEQLKGSCAPLVYHVEIDGKYPYVEKLNTR